MSTRNSDRRRCRSHEDLYFGKLDFEPSDYDRIEFSVKVRNESQINNLGISESRIRGHHGQKQ